MLYYLLPKPFQNDQMSMRGIFKKTINMYHCVFPARIELLQLLSSSWLYISQSKGRGFSSRWYTRMKRSESCIETITNTISLPADAFKGLINLLV